MRTTVTGRKRRHRFGVRTVPAVHSHHGAPARERDGDSTRGTARAENRRSCAVQ